MAARTGGGDDGEIDLKLQAEWMAIARHEASRPLTPEEEQAFAFASNYDLGAYELMDEAALRKALALKDNFIERLREAGWKLEEEVESLRERVKDYE